MIFIEILDMIPLVTMKLSLHLLGKQWHRGLNKMVANLQALFTNVFIFS